MKKKKERKQLKKKIQETKIHAIRYFPAGIICGPHRGSFAVRDHCGPIGHFGKYHNILCLSPQILHKHCFQFLLGNRVVPRENKNNAHAKFGGTNKEYYGIFRSGLFGDHFRSGDHLRSGIICGAVQYSIESAPDVNRRSINQG